MKFKTVLSNGYNKESVKTWVRELNEVLDKANAAAEDIELAKIYSFIGRYNSNLVKTKFGGYDKNEVDRYIDDLINKINNKQNNIKFLLESNGFDTSFSQKTLQDSYLSEKDVSLNNIGYFTALISFGLIIIAGGVLTYTKLIIPKLSTDSNSDIKTTSLEPIEEDEKMPEDDVEVGYDQEEKVTMDPDIVTTTTTIPEVETTTTTTTAPPEPKKSFTAFSDACTWEEAEEKCEEKGGHLAYVTSSKDYKAIIKSLKGTELKFVWLGGTTRINRNGDVVAEWLDGSDFDYVEAEGLWFKGEPSGRDFTSDDEPLEPYVMLWNVNDEWSLNDNSDAALDYYKHSYIGYICEFEEY